MTIEKNTPVNFQFRTHSIVGSELRCGSGVVVDETIVGTDRAYVIRVTSGPSYAPGEYIDVRARHVGLIAEAA